MYVPDIIVAQATPVGQGAIGIVRLSGTGVLTILDKIFSGRARAAQMESHRFYLGRLLDPNKETALDEVLVVFMGGPHSYTGEDTVEIHAHGSPYILKRIVGLALEQGARLADPGEFTKRAYLNDRMDLSQAEAVCDLISAQSEWAAANALKQLDGQLSALIEGMRGGILEVCARIEAGFDFVEEDVSLFDVCEGIELLNGIASRLEQLLDSFQTGRLYKEGLRVALVGRPNVGKSSLLNALLREDRAIVHDEPGTTRDVLFGEGIIEGLVVHFFDTAGLRDGVSPIEQAGIERTYRTIQRADIVALVFDTSVALAPEDFALLESHHQRPHIVILNKVDRPAQWHPEQLCHSEKYYPTSATQRRGLTEVEQALVEMVGAHKIGDHNYVLNNVRHQRFLEKAHIKLIDVIQQLRSQQISEECLIEELRIIIRDLEGVLGLIDSEAVLDEVFSRFCIGK